MKLIIQIPCLNEEKTLPETIADLPRHIDGVDTIEYLIIDDGSVDRTSEIAREVGVHHVVRFPQNRGLARAFMAGIDACLRLGADIIVNTDADNQYSGADIPALVRPIVEHRADFVVGDRQIEAVDEFSETKKRLQRFGSWVVRLASNTRVPDTTSGFRAISREAALRMFVTSEFTYTLETIIQAGHANLAVDAVPIRTNPKTRDSRLFKSIPQYIRRSMATIVRIYTMYKPLKAFIYLASLLFLGGLVLGVRFLYFHLTSGPQGAGHIQSLILAAVLTIVAFIVLLSGLIADLVAANRKLLQDAIIRLRRLEYDGVPQRDRDATASSATTAAAGTSANAPAADERVEPPSKLTT
ncbi:MAG: glycosyltransferase family 2 protein [Myxococcales bacterium]|nr:glycosyltransferase family 2 protein [Myxococcales bacterium]